MNEIAELYQKLLSDFPQIVEDVEPLRLDRGSDLKMSMLHEPTVELSNLAEAIQKRLDSIVPKDFHYCVEFCEYGPTISFEFRNGGNITSFGPRDIDEVRSIEDQLRSINWAKRRSDAQNFDAAWAKVQKLIDRSPVNPTPTKIRQRMYQEDIDAWLKEPGRSPSEVHLLVLDDENKISELAFESREVFEEHFPQVLLSLCEVVAVIADGKQMPPNRVDELKAKEWKKIKKQLPAEYEAVVRMLDVEQYLEGKLEDEDD